MLVRFEIDGVAVTGTLLSSPNAIGVCRVSRHGETLQRHWSRLSPEDDDARICLDKGEVIEGKFKDAAALVGVDAEQCRGGKYPSADSGK